MRKLFGLVAIGVATFPLAIASAQESRSQDSRQDTQQQQEDASRGDDRSNTERQDGRRQDTQSQDRHSHQERTTTERREQDRSRDQRDTREREVYRDHRDQGFRDQQQDQGRYRDQGRYLEGDRYTSSRTRQSRGWTTDSQIIACLAADNQTELAVARLAADQAESDDVAEFAEMLIDDHQQLMADLRDIDTAAVAFATSSQRGGQGFARGQADEEMRGRAYDSGRLDRESDRGRDANQQRRYLEEDRDRASETTRGQFDFERERQATRGQYDRSATSREIELERTGRTFFDAETSSGRQFAGLGLDFVTIKREIAQLHRQSVLRELEQKEGDAFDEAFLNNQIAAHMQLIDALKVLQNYASRDLRPVLQDAIERSQDHLDEARDLKEQIRR